MVKSLLIKSALFVTTNSFSFWPMEDIYYMDIDRIKAGRLYIKKNGQIYKLKNGIGSIKYNIESIKRRIIFFLYDPHTNNSLSKEKTIDNATLWHMYYENNPEVLNSSKRYKKEKGLNDIKSKIYNFTKNTSIEEINLTFDQMEKICRELSNLGPEDEKQVFSSYKRKCNINFNDNIKKSVSFLTCNFTYNSSFWREESLMLMNDYKTNATDNYNRFLLPQNKKPQLIFNPDGSATNEAEYYIWNGSQSIKFQKVFYSLSGVKIENTENGVMLSKGGQSVNLDTALKRYYKRNSFQTDLCSAYNTYKEKRATAEDPKYHYRLFLKNLKPELNRMNSTTLTNTELEKLENSTILALWYLILEVVEIKDEKGSVIKVKEERQMLGLARDNKTGKLFHWTTDLNQDISVLMQHAWDLK